MEAKLWNKIKDAYADVLDLQPEGRPAYLDGLPPDVRAEVERLLAASSDAGDFIEKPFLIEQGAIAADGPLDAATIDDYKIVSTLGMGGMGTVYLAEHVGYGFSQQVALKLIKSGMGTDIVQRRFLVERQILASLDHPNIARMLDGGSTDAGHPYFVMEYVDGQPIRSYCDDRSLNTRSRVALFSKVCDAVSYAHQKLVVHRDIKPSNILVEGKGEPKLLDFGIAKLLAPDWQSSVETVTATQFRILTPEYASPEQLRGEATTTLTDVYSLGVVLYELLTGVRPFHDEVQSPAALAEAIRTKEPRRPSVAALFDTTSARRDDKATAREAANRTGELAGLPNTRRSVPDPQALCGDIDNIVLKAIRHEPEDRYQSVRELLEDIERYLSGLPVKATGDTVSYRLKKFVKRNRAAVAIGGLSAAIVCSALAFSVYQYSVANRERSRAEARFKEVRQFANAILFDHFDKIQNLPGSTEAKAKLASEAVTYLDAISKDLTDDPELMRELAKGYRKLAEVQGITVGSGDMGNLEAARSSLRKVIDIREALLAVEPGNIEDQRQLGFALAEYSYVGTVTLQERVDYGQRSFAIFEGLRSANPDKEQSESDYARGLWDRANTIRRTGDNAGAIRNFTEAVAIYEALYNNGAGHKKFRRSAALTHKNLGTVYRVAGDPASALARYEKALAYDQVITSETPDAIDARLALSFSRRGVAEALNALGRYDEALRSVTEAMQIQEAIRDSDPSNAFAADNLFDSYVVSATAYSGLRKFNEAEAYFRKAFELEASLKRQENDVLRMLAIAKGHLEYAQTLIDRSGRAQEARSELTKALEVFENAKAREALDPAFAPDYERAKALLQAV